MIFNWAFVVQLPPEGANGEHHFVGLCDERLGVGDLHVPEVRRARGLHLYGLPHGYPTLGDDLRVAAAEIFNCALAVGRQECAQVADVLLEGDCLPLQLLLQLALCGRAESGRCTSQLLRESEHCLGLYAMPGSVCLVCRRRARCQGVVAGDPRLELFPALRVVPSCWVGSRRGRLPRPTTRARASCAVWECSNTLSTAAAGMDP